MSSDSLDSLSSAGSILVTGTDTGIGKTYFSTWLVRELKKRDLNVFACKPIETGCELDDDGKYIAADACLLRDSLELNGCPQELGIIEKLYRSPVAPLVAAEHENDPIEWSELLSFIAHAKAKGDCLIVEGAGGVLVPITDEKNFIDLALEGNLSTIVVVGTRLGAINQAALTFEVLKSKGVDLLGYVYNEVYHPEGQVEEPGVVTAAMTNRDLLSRVAEGYGIRELFEFPHTPAV